MTVFQSVSQLASWAGVCPGNNESAGKRKSTQIPKGNVYLKTALVEAANAAARSKGTYLRDKFYRLKARRGYKRAAVAIAHKILVSIYHMFSCFLSKSLTTIWGIFTSTSSIRTTSLATWFVAWNVWATQSP